MHAISLSGGSAYGLAAADGVMQCLESQGVGMEIAGQRVPVVPAAILFDPGRCAQFPRNANNLISGIGSAAADALSRAVVRAIRNAQGIHTATCNVNSYCDQFPANCAD